MKNTEKRGIYVTVKNNNIDKALKQFKKKIKESGIMLELKEREYYEKPSVSKREKRKKSLSRMRNANAKIK